MQEYIYICVINLDQRNMEIICPKHKCKSTKISYATYSFYYDCSCNECNWYFLVPFRPNDGCCTKSYLVDVIHHFDCNSHVIYEQCIHCGWTLKKKPKKLVNADIRGEFNKEWNDEWHEKKSEEHKSLTENINLQNNFWYRYNIYLSTNEWKIKREEVFQRDMNLCQICKLKTSNEVHHLTYKNVFNEKLEDLVAVCHECHVEHHKTIKIPDEIAKFI